MCDEKSTKSGLSDSTSFTSDSVFFRSRSILTCVLKWDMPAAGVLIGAAGLAGVVYAWPLYQKVLKKEREKAVRELPESGGNA